jgi:lysophospholipid acyltransferase (LPLAT)-like uncharacterized protein
MGAAVLWGKTLDRSWDRFVIAWPFSTVAVVLGAPLEAGAPTAAVTEAIAAANAGARNLLN